jgi:hypothetical protein
MISANNETRYRIYCEPKTGADGLPHYAHDDYRELSFRTKESAQQHIDEMLNDGVGKFWELKIRAI